MLHDLTSSGISLLLGAVFLAGCSGGPAVPEIKAEPATSCISVVNSGPSAGTPDSTLVSAAIQDGKSNSRHQLTFYKALAGFDVRHKYYVFYMEGLSDVYRIYLADENARRLEGKFTFNEIGGIASASRMACVFPK